MPFAATDRPPLAPRTWPSWVGIGLLVALARLPWSWQQALGRGLGALLRRRLHARREIAARNLALCFPEIDAAAQDALLRAHFAALYAGSLLARAPPPVQPAA
jgi:KDO2-lipid IV(A) lauroyltransferase